MKELFAYKFRSPLTIEKIHAKLVALGTWSWHERDSDRWGFYTSASPVPDADRAQVKILVDPDTQDWFALNVLFQSARPAATSQFAELRSHLFTRILPAISASQLTEAGDHE